MVTNHTAWNNPQDYEASECCQMYELQSKTAQEVRYVHRTHRHPCWKRTPRCSPGIRRPSCRPRNFLIKPLVRGVERTMRSPKLVILDEFLIHKSRCSRYVLAVCPVSSPCKDLGIQRRKSLKCSYSPEGRELGFGLLTTAPVLAVFALRFILHCPVALLCHRGRRA